MKKFIKNTLPLFAIAVAILLVSCSNPLAKNVYKCEDEQTVVMEFKKDYSVVIFWDLPEVKPESEQEDKYAPKKLQLATGSYRLSDKFLTVTIGTSRDITTEYTCKDDKWPQTFSKIRRGDEYTFQIQDDGNLCSNIDGKIWKKQQ